MMIKKRMKISQTSLLRRRWTMLTANHMVEVGGLSRSYALKQANATWDVLSGLGDGVVEFAYREEDGSIRRARGTLKRGVSAYFDAWLNRPHKSRKSNNDGDETFIYWDLDCEDWRSFKASRLVDLNLI